MEFLKIIFRKSSEILVNYVRLFWGKWIFWQENVTIFENWIHFLNLWIVFKNETSQPSGGGLLSLWLMSCNPRSRGTPSIMALFARSLHCPYNCSIQSTLAIRPLSGMGVARIFFGRGNTLSKKFSKMFQKIAKQFL